MKAESNYRKCKANYIKYILVYLFGSWRVLPNRRVLSTPAGCSFAWRTEQRQPSYTVHCLCICLFSQVCLLTVVVQHAVSGQGSQAAAVPSLWGQGTVVKICAPMYSCKPSSDLREPLERWQKVGGFSIPVRKTTNLLSLELMCSSVLHEYLLYLSASRKSCCPFVLLLFILVTIIE